MGKKKRDIKASEDISAKSTPVPGPESNLRLKKKLGIIIAIFSFILYAQSISHSYTLDDGPAINLNRYTTQGIQGIPTLIKTDYWYGFRDELRGPVYRPTSLVMFAIEWELFPNKPGINHFFNVLLYAITCWLLFMLLCKFDIPFLKEPKTGILFAFICSLLYAAHPIHTEVVNTIKSRDEINCFLFGILSIFLTLKFISKKSIIALLIGGVCFFLSLISKETGITFLIIIPLILYSFTKAPPKAILKIFLLLISITLVYLMLRMEVLKSVPENNVPQSPLNNTLFAAPDFLSRQATAFYVLLKYIGLLVFPHPLTHDYNYSQIEVQYISSPNPIIGMIVYFTLFVYALIKIRKRELTAFAILFYLLSLSPVSNIFFVGGSTMAERFMYIPSLGFCIILGYFIVKFSKRSGEITNRNQQTFKNIKHFISGNKVVMTITFSIIFLYSIKTISRNFDWQDDLTIYRQDVKISDNSATAHFAYGSALLTHLFPEEKDDIQKAVILNESIEEISKAISIYSAAPIYYLKLGQAYMNKHDNNSAIKNLEFFLQHYPKPDADTYIMLGNIYMEEKQYEKAIKTYELSIERNPESPEGYYDAGTALLKSKRYMEAMPLFQKAIEKKPNFVEAYCNMGCVLAGLDKMKEALVYFKKGSQIDSTYSKNYYFLGLTYQILGDSVNSKINFAKNARLTH